MRTWVKRTIAVVVTVGVLGGLGEVALRLIIPSVIAGAVRTQLDLTDDHPVEVSLGGSALLHAFTGRVGDVAVEIPNTPLIDGVTADARLDAGSVPFNPTAGDIRDASVTLSVSPEQLGPIISTLSSGFADTGEVRNGALTVGRNMEVFGQDVPLSATLRLAVGDGGDVLVTPEELSAAGLDLSTEQIAMSLGPDIAPFLQPQTVCLRDQLPRGITLTDITLSSTGAVILGADLSPGILSDPAEQQPGTCG